MTVGTCIYYGTDSQSTYRMWLRREEWWRRGYLRLIPAGVVYMNIYCSNLQLKIFLSEWWVAILWTKLYAETQTLIQNKIDWKPKQTAMKVREDVGENQYSPRKRGTYTNRNFLWRREKCARNEFKFRKAARSNDWSSKVWLRMENNLIDFLASVCVLVRAVRQLGWSIQLWFNICLGKAGQKMCTLLKESKLNITISNWDHGCEWRLGNV